METLYHMQTKEQRHKKNVAYGVIAACIVIVLIVCVAAFRSFHESSLEQGAISVKEAVLDSAIQCAAIEGSYPSELSHLEENYGLSINHNDYIVIYVCFASNSVPTVSVVPR